MDELSGVSVASWEAQPDGGWRASLLAVLNGEPWLLEIGVALEPAAPPSSSLDVRIVREVALSGFEDTEGVAVVAPGVATQLLPLAPSTSRATILPPGPVPVTLWRSTPKSFASLRA